MFNVRYEGYRGLIRCDSHGILSLEDATEYTGQPNIVREPGLKGREDEDSY